MRGFCNVDNVRKIKVTHEWHEAIKTELKKNKHAMS
jgi:hypothetical protein